jgi:hypothetical protein
VDEQEAQNWEGLGSRREPVWKRAYDSALMSPGKRFMVALLQRTPVRGDDSILMSGWRASVCRETVQSPNAGKRDGSCGCINRA